MHLAEAGVGVGGEIIEVVKLLSTGGSAGLLAWVLYWLFTKELPRRDDAAKKLAEAYEGRIDDLRKTQKADAERYAESCKEMGAKFAAELQRIREADMSERRAERNQAAALMRDQTKALEHLVLKVSAIPAETPDPRRG